MVVVYLDKNTQKCFPYSQLRTDRGAKLQALNLESPAIQKMLQVSPSGEGIRGFGINTFGTGINIMGSGGLFPVCKLEKEVQQLDHLVVRGNGIASDFKKAGNKVFAWTKKNIMPLLRVAGKHALESGKRVGADVVADVAPHVATLGSQYLDKKLGNSLVGNLAQQGLALAGNTAQKKASDYVKEQNKASPYNGLETKGADAIKRLSLARLQAEMKKNEPAKKTGKGYTQDHVMY